MKELYRFKEGFKDGGIDAVAFLATGLLAAASGDKVAIINLGQPSEHFALDRIRTRSTDLEFHPDGRSLLIGGADGRIYRWRFADEREQKTIKDQQKAVERYIGHGTVINAVAYHPYERVFFSADWKGILSAWLAYDADRFGGKYDVNLFPTSHYFSADTKRATKRGSDDPITQLSVTPNGERLIAATQKGKIEIWSVRGFAPQGSFEAHQGLIYSLAVSPDGKMAITVGRDGLVRVWNLQINFEKDEMRIVEPLKDWTVSDARLAVFVDQSQVAIGDLKGHIEVKSIN
jgi:WD40 repeat protein